MTLTLGLAIFIFALLMAGAGLLIVWSRGLSWPLESEMVLTSWVVGDPLMQRMPPALLLRMIALALAFGAATALALGMDQSAPMNDFVTYSGAGFCGVFALRGLCGYLPLWRNRFTVEPFSTIDRMIYSPGCILIAEAFFSLLSERF